MNKKLIKDIKRVKSCKRLNSSVYGNPRYEISFTDGLTGKTQTDAPIGYYITDPTGYEYLVTYHITASGNMIINDLEPVLVDANDDYFCVEFDDLSNLTNEKYERLYKRARSVFYQLRRFTKGHTFENEACFISTNYLHGFFFPNMPGTIRAIAFEKGCARVIFDF